MLDDTSVITIYAVSAKVLLERGMLATTRDELRKIKKETSHKNSINNYKTPTDYTKRGKIRRHSKNSILLDFLDEDWGFLFTGTYDESRDYYVYYHTDLSKGTSRFKKDGKTIDFFGRPFYVGKGKGDRYKNKKRSRSHISVINELIDRGLKESDIFHIFRGGLTEKEAFELEAKLITFFGCDSELDSKKAHFHGMKGGWLINADPASRPSDVDKMMRVKGRNI